MQTTGVRHFIRNHVRGISPKVRINFFRQMAVLTGAGITLIKALEMLHRQSKGNLKYLIGDTINLIEQGGRFSTIGQYYTVFFDKTICSMLEAGEESGNIQMIFREIHHNLEINETFKKRLKGAMLVPLLTLLFAVGVVFYLSIKVVPEFSRFIESMGGELPTTTQYLLDFSGYMQQHWELIAQSIGLGVGVWLIAYKLIRPFRYGVQRLWLATPLFGTISLFSMLSLFSNSMEKLFGSGVGLVESLEIAKEGVKSLPLQAVIDRSMEGIIAGGSLSLAFEKASIVPLIYGDLLIAGEESGRLDDSFRELALIYREEADERIAILQRLIPPIMTLLIGGIVGMIAMSLLIGMMAMWAQQSL